MALDPVNHKDLKGKHKNAKDKDIDNDGDTDSSDEYLHKRRQAVSKAIGKIKEGMAEQAAGLWANIHAKRKRIEAGSGERMRAPGSKGAPSADSLKRARSATESAEIKEEAYRKPTQAEIDADRKKDEKGKPRPSISAKSVMRKTYGNMMGGLKNEEIEQIDEIQINWNHKTQKYHTIKHPDGSHWGVFDHSSYGTKGHEIRKIKDSDGNALKASDSRKNHSAGYKSGMGSPADAAKAWAKKHGGTITDHKIKEEVEIDEASYRDSGYRNMLKASRKADKEADKMRAQQAKSSKSKEVKEEADQIDEISRDLVRRYIRKVSDKTNTGELTTKQVMKRRPGVNLAGKKAYPGIAGEPRVRATESAEFKTEAKDGDGANIVRDREFKEPKFKFKSHPYGSPEWHANKAAHEKFKAKQAAQAAKKAMKNEEVEKTPTELPADKKPLRMKLAHFRHQE
jgi:hypothetical protein